MKYRFDEFVLDSRLFELTRDGEAVNIQPLALAMLLYLVENRGRLASKDELIDNLWSGRIVSDSAITVVVRALRQALGNDGRSRGYIKTQYGRGFRFVGDIAVEPDSANPASADGGEPSDPTADDLQEQEPYSHAGRPSIAVLPFRLTGVAGPHAVLAEAIPDEVITALAKLRWLFVIARGSCFQFPSYDFSVEEVGRKLKVGYCLSGAMEIIGDDVTVSVELSDTRTAQVVWRDRFAVRLGGLQEVRDEIARKIATAIDSHIPAHEIDRARLLSPGNLDAWQNYHLGLGLVMGADLDRYRDARALFRQALQAEPTFARARAGLANTLFLETLFRPSDAREIALRALAEASKAYELDSSDPYCSLMRARTELQTGDFASGMARLDQVIESTPSYSIAYSDLARMLIVAGQTQAARTAIETAISLNPVDPYNHTSFITLSLIELVEGHVDAAVSVAKQGKLLRFRSLDDRIVALMAFHEGDETHLARREAAAIKRDFADLNLATYLDPIPILTDSLKASVEKIFATYLAR